MQLHGVNITHWCVLVIDDNTILKFIFYLVYFPFNLCRGLYDQLQEYDLPYPEAIFDLGYYKKNPTAFVHLSKVIWPGQEAGPKPTLSHAFLRLLEKKGCLQRIYTQNIDGLEALAGVSTDKLVECHGHFRSSSCVVCKKQMPIVECRKKIINEGTVPICRACGSFVKPDICIRL